MKDETYSHLSERFERLYKYFFDLPQESLLLKRVLDRIIIIDNKMKSMSKCITRDYGHSGNNKGLK